MTRNLKTNDCRILRSERQRLSWLLRTDSVSRSYLCNRTQSYEGSPAPTDCKNKLRDRNVRQN